MLYKTKQRPLDGINFVRFSPLPFQSGRQVNESGDSQMVLYLKPEAEINVYSPFGFP